MAKPDPKQKYPLAYKIVIPDTPLTREQLTDKDGPWEGFGACDAVLIASIIYPPDGSLSILFIGEDGRTKTVLPDNEWFKVWMMLASRLSKSQTLSPEKASMCAAVMALIRRAMFQQGPEGG